MPAMDYRWRAPEKLISVEDYRRAAKRRLPQMVWTYVDGGADDLVTLGDNRDAFSRWAFKPRVLAGMKQAELATTVAGVPLDLPVLLAPTGLTGLSYWKGDIAAARAAEQHGTRYVLSTASSWSIEEVAAASQQDPWFQLYPRSGELTQALMTRAWDAGVRVMFVTVDSPLMGNREGERKKGMGHPPVLTPVRAANMATHPRWVYDVLRHRRISGRNIVAGGGIRAALESVEIQNRELLQSTLNWDDVAWIRDRWPGALYAKGVLDPRDAERAVDLGFEGIVVSNHGGRQLDYARSTLDCLPEIAAAVGTRAEVLLDGGIRRGSDVVKALALGARAVLIGRPYIYGLAVDGERGAAAVLEILRAELARTMILLGVAKVSELDSSVLTPRIP
jgi:isopentenyl diphosphate isomerase/L-lactate dehydrogenase-like FMN-dependent dehydrogenase